MSAKAEKSTNSELGDYSLDWLRWLATLALVVGAVVANSVYSQFPLLYRVVALIVVALVAFWIAVYTKQGSSIWLIVRDSQTEVRKVVWSTRQEIFQTSLIVVAMVIVMALILWGLDAFFNWIASSIIG